MAIREKAELHMVFAGDVDNNIEYTFSGVTSNTAQLGTAIDAMAPLLNNKSTKDATAVYDYSYIRSDTIIHNAQQP